MRNTDQQDQSEKIQLSLGRVMRAILKAPGRAAVFGIIFGLGGCSTTLSNKLIGTVQIVDPLGQPISSVRLECKPRNSASESGRYRTFSINGDPLVNVPDSTPEAAKATATHNKLLALAEFGNFARQSSAGESASSSGNVVEIKTTNTKAQEFSAAELIDYFIKVLNSGLSNEAKATAQGFASASDAWKDDPWEVWRRYYVVYANEGFITRDGTQLKKFEVAKNIGNETIAAIARIFLEGLFDTIYKSPVVLKTDSKTKTVKYLDSGDGSKKPTALALGVLGSVEVLPEDQADRCGVTETEVRYIKAISSLDSEAAALLSKSLGEMFGNFNVSVGLGAEFKIGDADTLKTLVQTFSETVVQSQRRAILYEFFYHFSYAPPAKKKASESATARSVIPQNIARTDGEGRLFQAVAVGLQAAQR